jgi:hypothetical protein
MKQLPAHAIRVLGIAGQDVSQRCFEHCPVLLGFRLDFVEQPRGPGVLADLELDLVNLVPAEQEIGMASRRALSRLLLRYRGGAEGRNDEDRYSRGGLARPRFFHCSLNAVMERMITDLDALPATLIWKDHY